AHRFQKPVLVTSLQLYNDVLVSKAILSFLCYQIPNPTMYAVAQDHRNDVFSNIIALACGIIASKALDGSIKAEEVVAQWGTRRT
ncbi:unnamed protein product, partial [Rotaria sp. Silwood1]